MHKPYHTTITPTAIPEEFREHLPEYVKRVASLSRQDGRILVQFFTEFCGQFYAENVVHIRTRDMHQFVLSIPEVWVWEEE